MFENPFFDAIFDAMLGIGPGDLEVVDDPINKGAVELNRNSKIILMNKYGLTEEQSMVIGLLAGVKDPLTPVFNLALGVGTETKSDKPNEKSDWFKEICEKYGINGAESNFQDRNKCSG